MEAPVTWWRNITAIIIFNLFSFTCHFGDWWDEIHFRLKTNSFAVPLHDETSLGFLRRNFINCYSL